MKKFIGNVNGVEYTNRVDFNKAVTKAMSENNETLVITSYEKVVPNENIITTDEYMLDVDTTDSDIKFEITDELKKKLIMCDNKDAVLLNIKNTKNEWFDLLEQERASLKKIICDMEKKTNEVEKIQKYYNYYSKLIDIINNRGEKSCICDKCNCEKHKTETPNKEESFDNFLRKTGFFSF